MTLNSSSPGTRQRGAAALIVTLMLFFAMVVVAAFVNRNLVFEQHIAANQVRSTQAFEAAEAGLEWALAQLNSERRIDADCKPTDDPTANSFRTRYLGSSRTNAILTPRTWTRAGSAAALQPTCVRSTSAWACSCPTSGAPLLSVRAGDRAVAAFTLQFLPTGSAGIVRVAAIGCTGLAGGCQPGSAGSTDATARLEVALGLHAGLRTTPVAAFTARGEFSADGAALGVHNADPATGIGIHAGGGIAANQARLTAPAGASLASAFVGRDASLAALSTDQFFARTFGLDKRAWTNLPAVTHIACTTDCADAITAAIASSAGSALIWVESDLELSGPLTLGTPTRPVAIVVGGMARFSGAIALTGAIYSAAMTWSDTSGGAFVRGAVLIEGSYRGNGAPEFSYDPAVLATLAGTSGSFARVSGSWRDF